jgi:hypothetical protein
VVRSLDGRADGSGADADGLVNSTAADRLHLNAIKALARCGQGDSLSDEGLAPVGLSDDAGDLR